MKNINGLYTQYFNRTHNTDGALFRGRYKAVLVDALAEYKWSSYSVFIKSSDA